MSLRHKEPKAKREGRPADYATITPHIDWGHLFNNHIVLDTVARHLPPKALNRLGQVNRGLRAAHPRVSRKKLEEIREKLYNLIVSLNYYAIRAVITKLPPDLQPPLEMIITQLDQKEDLTTKDTQLRSLPFMRDHLLALTMHIESMHPDAVWTTLSINALWPFPEDCTALVDDLYKEVDDDNVEDRSSCVMLKIMACCTEDDRWDWFQWTGADDAEDELEEMDMDAFARTYRRSIEALLTFMTHWMMGCSNESERKHKRAQFDAKIKTLVHGDVGLKSFLKIMLALYGK